MSRTPPPRRPYVRACGATPCPYHASRGGPRLACRDTPVQKDKRGFRGMSPEQHRRIASLGGKAAHRNGTAHEFSFEEAVAAGRLGGLAVSQNREHMKAIGRLGGEA